jgi:hypothetical protein
MFIRFPVTEEFAAMCSSVLFGVAMTGIGVTLLLRPLTFPALLRSWNPQNESLEPQVARLEQPSSRLRLRLLGILIIVWGAFCGYLGLSSLLHQFS